MKKNAMLKIAAVLLVAVLLTTCAISSTFAKYVTDVDFYTETARVAKWGVSATLTTTGQLFNVSYDAEDTDKEVLASTNVIAPGTSGSVTIDYKVEGTPEVALKIDVFGKPDAEHPETPTTNFIVVSDDDLAKELIWTVAGTDYTTVADANDAIKNYFNTTYYPDDDLTTAKDSIVVAWRWEFENTTENDNALGAEDAYEGNVVDFYIDANIVQVGQ